MIRANTASSDRQAIHAIDRCPCNSATQCHGAHTPPSRSADWTAPQRAPIRSVSLSPPAADSAVRLCRPLKRHPTHGVSLVLQTIQGQREQSRDMAMRGHRIPGDFECGDLRQNDIQRDHSVRLDSTAFARIAIALTIRVSEQPRTIMGPEIELRQPMRTLERPIGWLNKVPRTASPTVRHSPGNTGYSAAVASRHRGLAGRVRPIAEVQYVKLTALKQSFMQGPARSSCRRFVEHWVH